MGQTDKLSWLQRLGLKAIGLPSAIVVNPGFLQQVQNQAMERFQSVIMNTIGVSALWNNEAFERAYLNNGMVYTIVNRIASTAAIAPFKVYRVKDKKKHYQYKHWTGEHATWESIQKSMLMKSLVYEEDTVHPMNKLIETPNPWQKGNEFVINSVGFKLLTGNRFIYQNILDIGADKGKPWQIWNLPPQFVTIVSDGSIYGVKEYRFNMSTPETVPLENIIHSKYFNPEFNIDGSHLLGLSPLRAANRNRTRSDAAVDRSTSTLQNAGSPGALINEEGTDMTVEQSAAMRDDMNSRIRGRDNAGKISLLNGKWNYLNFGMTSGDMQLLDLEKYTNEQLCNIFSVPPGLFNPDKATYENSKEFKKELITGAVIPALSSMRDDFNDIAKGFKDDVYVDYDLNVYPELQDDLEKTARILSFAWWFKGNEKRLATGQDEDPTEPMMDTYLVPNNLVPIAQLGDNTQELLDAMDGVTDTGLGADPNK